MPSLKKPKAQKNPKKSGKTPDGGAERRKERTPYHGAAFAVFSSLLYEYQRNGDVALHELLEKCDGVYYIKQKGVAAEKSLAIQVMAQMSEPLLQAMDKSPLDEVTAGKVAEHVAAVDDEVMKCLNLGLRRLRWKIKKIYLKGWAK